MNNETPIESYPHLIKKNNSVISTDKKSLLAAKNKKNKSTRIENKINIIEERIDSLESSLQEIINLLKK